MPFISPIFQKDHPGEPVPEMHVFSPEERIALNRRAARSLAWDDLDDWLRVPWIVFDQSVSAPGLKADAEGFHLDTAAAGAGVTPSAWVVVDWFGGDQVLVRWADLVAYLEDFWYPSQDHIAVFDQTFRWMLFITDAGDVRIAADY